MSVGINMEMLTLEHGGFGLLHVISQSWDFCTYIKVFTMAYAFHGRMGYGGIIPPRFHKNAGMCRDGAATMDIKFGRTVRGLSC